MAHTETTVCVASINLVELSENIFVAYRHTIEMVVPTEFQSHLQTGPNAVVMITGRWLTYYFKFN